MSKPVLIEKLAVTNGNSSLYFEVGKFIDKKEVTSITHEWEQVPRLDEGGEPGEWHHFGYAVWSEHKLRYMVPLHSVVYIRYAQL